MCFPGLFILLFRCYQSIGIYSETSKCSVVGKRATWIMNPDPSFYNEMFYGNFLKPQYQLQIKPPLCKVVWNR